MERKLGKIQEKKKKKAKNPRGAFVVGLAAL